MAKSCHKKLLDLSKRQKNRRLSVAIKKAHQIKKASRNNITLKCSEKLLHTHIQERDYDKTETFVPEVPTDTSELEVASNAYTPEDPTNTSQFNLDKTVIHAPEQDTAACLKQWSISHKITQSALSDLLKVLNQHSCFSHLPQDARSFLATPRTTVVKRVDPGQYVHFGLKSTLSKLLDQHRVSHVELQFNIDGLPLFKSSSMQFWPILCSILGFKNVFPVGIYVGNEKPSDVNLYLSQFVDELNQILVSGLIIENRVVEIKVHSFICDAPARAYICCIKGHSGYYGCGKCISKGKYVENRVVYTKAACNLRTDTSFRQRLQVKHHNGNSVLENLPIDMVNAFPFEYMHLICLGVMRKLLLLWIKGKPGPYKLHKRSIDTLSSLHCELAKALPIEFGRKSRSLWEIDRWKASELRTFLLYTGPIILCNVIKVEQYNLFLNLSVAVRILAMPHQKAEMIDYAESLLIYFVAQFKTLFGKVNLSYNVHGLLHLARDVRQHGHLDQFSAFKFENYLGQLKKIVRSPNLPLQQVHRRLSERDDKVLTPNLQPCKFLKNQRGAVLYKGFVLKEGTTVLLLTGEFVKIKSEFSNNKKFIGNVLVKIRSFFTEPCDSSLHHIFILQLTESSVTQEFDLSLVFTKCVVFTLSETEIVVFPLILIN